MGTRSLTRIIGLKGPLTTIYRQFDGYPEGHGVDIAKFLDNKRIVNGYTDKDEKKGNFNGMGCLAAQLIAELKKGIGNIYIYEPDVSDCWEEYTYIITEKDGIPNIECPEIKFNGSPREFLDKYQ